MKAFIAITLLAACCAAQTFDYNTGLRQPLLKKEHGLSGLWKDVFGINKKYPYDFDTIRSNNYYPYTVPTSYTDNNNNVDGVNILSLDEIIHHPLFQTYYTLPLFRQHFNHPLFKLYLTTPYFQQYWTHPIFTTFFRNPYLFNKYIYPVVYNTFANGIYDRAYDAKNIFGDYKTNIHTTIPFDTTYGKKYTDVVYPFNTGYPINSKHIQYTDLIDKVIKTHSNIRPEITNVNFDIESPIHGENIFEKHINPITGEITYTTGDIKTIDDEYTIHRNKQIDAAVEKELKNLLIRKIFLNKIINGNRQEHIQNIPEILKFQTAYPRELINKYETIVPREHITETPRQFQKYSTITPLANYETIARKYETEIPRDSLAKFEAIPRDLLAKYTITPINKEEIETPPRKFIINRFDTTIPRQQHVNKVENIPITKIEIEKIPTEKMINKVEGTPITKIDKETIPREFIAKEETIPREFTTKEEKIPQEELIHNKIDSFTTTTPELTKKFDEMESNIDKATTTNDETVDTIRVRRHAPLGYTHGHQVYTVPATQYVVGEQHQAQVPLTKTSVHSTTGQQTYVPLTYNYGTHYIVPTTYVQQPSVYYPTQTYITA